MYTIVQSYWSKPSFDSAYPQEDNRFGGGWIHERYNYMSWALSCLTLRKYYKNVILFTDDLGKELLIDRLELLYTDVRLDLNDLEKYDSRLWAVGKLYTYSLQDKPFIHVDGDVYIWNKFNLFSEKQDIIVQNKYDFTTHHNYEKVKKFLLEELNEVPDAIVEQWKKQTNLFSINAGVIGGVDIAFFKEYTKRAFDFIHSNTDKIPFFPRDYLNVIFEEVLFFCMASQSQKNISCLFPVMDEEFTKVTCFHMVPKLATYIHLLGRAKKDKFAGQQVERRLRYEFPSYYEKINSYFASLKKEPVNNANKTTFYQTVKEENSSNSYCRTISLLKFLNADFQYNSFDELANHIEQIAQLQGQNTLIQNALIETFDLEKKKEELFQKALKRDVLKINQIYSFLDFADIDKILDTNFILSNAVVIECSWYMQMEDIKTDHFRDNSFFHKSEDNHFILCYLDDDNEIKEEVLSGWNVLLYAFTEPTNGNELVDFLIENYKKSEQSYNLDELKLNVVDLINRHLVMEGILDFAPVVSNSSNPD